MPSRSVRVASPVTSGSSSHSESDHGQASNTTLKGRPKLSDALRNVTLSPKRPRSPQISRSISLSPKQVSSSVSRGSQRTSTSHVPTPRPGRRNNIFPSYAPSLQQQPDLVLQPPTPSSAGSKFTRMAHGLAKEIEYEKDKLKSSMSSKRVERSRSASMPVDNNPFQDGTNQENLSANKANVSRISTGNRSRIQLPDVTGITNAIESPAKLSAEYYAYRAEGQIRETESKFCGQARTYSDLTIHRTSPSHVEHGSKKDSTARRGKWYFKETCKRTGDGVGGLQERSRSRANPAY